MAYAVAVDDTDVSTRALEHACTQARMADADVAVVHAVTLTVRADGPSPEIEPEAEAVERGERLLADAKAACPADLTVTTALVYGHPIDAIPDYVNDNDIDQLFVGHRDLAHEPAAPLESVAKTLIDAVDVPVTVVN